MPIGTKINTKTKKAHPIASKIPMYLWERIPESKFYVKTEKFEGKALEELTRADFPVDKQSAVIGFLLYYSHLKPSERFSYAQNTLADTETTLLMSVALGHNDLVSYFKNQEPDSFNHLNKSVILYRAFCSGNLEIIQWLKKEFPADFDNHIHIAQKNEFQFEFKFEFSLACLSGNLELVKWIKEQVSNELLMDIIQANNYGAFRNAVKSDNLSLLKWFKNQAPTQFVNMIKVSLEKNSIVASSNLSILRWLKKYAPDELSEALTQNYSLNLRAAVETGEVEILQWCAEQVPDGITDALTDCNFDSPLIEAFEYGDVEIIHWLLSKPAYFFQALRHHREYGEHVSSFIQNTLSRLHQTSHTTLINNPNEVFDVADEEQTHLCYYILAQIISHNDRTLDDEFHFLLNIPSVKAMVHLSIHQNPPNMLLRLAMDANNTLASELLLNIEAVRLEAERNNFYAQENRNGVDLSRLAQDRESSMTALTTGEAKKLESAISHYQPMLKSAGPSFVMQGLREELIERYTNNPASIKDSQGELIELPLEYEDLQALKLNKADYDKALIAYYQHDDHSAWRYLSKPNPWMHPQAAYVNVDDEDRTQRWSTFDEYQSLIAMFYLAATDKETEITEGHTLDTRLNHFIKELALIGRAHNWDRTRVRNGRREEFDDLQADRPSCYSGVKRRLFQSAIGHPLFDVLDEIKIENEIRQFAAWHFETILAKENKERIKEIIDKCYGLDGIFNIDHVDELRCFDIPEEKQAEFISYLTQKFAQFSEDKQFTSQVHEALFLNPEDEDLYKRYHVLKLFNLTNFYDFLDKSYQVNNEKETSEISEKSTTNQKNSVGFFQNKPQDNQPKEQDEKKNQLGDGPNIM